MSISEFCVELFFLTYEELTFNKGLAGGNFIFSNLY